MALETETAALRDLEVTSLQVWGYQHTFFQRIYRVFRRLTSHWHDIVLASSVLPSCENTITVFVGFLYVGDDAVPFVKEGYNNSRALLQPAFDALYSLQGDSWLPSAGTAINWLTPRNSHRKNASIESSLVTTSEVSYHVNA